MLWSVKDEDDDIKYPKIYSHGTCFENKFSTYATKCKDNDDHFGSLSGKFVATRKGATEVREHKNFETKRDPISMVSFDGKKYCGKPF